MSKDTLTTGPLIYYRDYESYRRAWKNSFQEDPPVPLNLDIELVSACNLACPFCFWGDPEFNADMIKESWDGKSKKRLMPTNLAIKLIADAAAIGVPALKFNWRGESTLHPEYSSILQYARKFPFHDIVVNTNGNMKKAVVDGLMATTKCIISVDSVVEETYAKMRVNGDLAVLIDIIEELIRRKHPDLWLRRVVGKLNQHEPFADNLRAIFGPDGYKVSEHFTFDRNRSARHQLGQHENMERTYCGYPSQRLVVASSGLVYPCCVDYDETMPVGNVAKQSLTEIWNGDAMKNLRKTLRANHQEAMSETCRNCTSWMAYKSKEREAVGDTSR